MADERKQKKEPRFCPYCDEEMTEATITYCKACGVTIFYCPVCREPLSRDNEVCPHCGADIREEACGGDE